MSDLRRALFLAVASTLVLSLAPAAQAGVAGKSYAGSLASRSGPFDACVEFGSNGDWSWSNAADSPWPSHQGTFTETDFFIFSIWETELEGRNPPFINGFSLLFGALNLMVLHGKGGAVWLFLPGECQAPGADRCAQPVAPRRNETLAEEDLVRVRVDHQRCAARRPDALRARRRP